MLENKTYIRKMNDLVAARTPFLFIIDFLGLTPLIYPLSELPKGLRFSTPGFPDSLINHAQDRLVLKKKPVSKKKYLDKFTRISEHISHGNSYLINLTQPTTLDINWNLKDIYLGSKAPYKLLINNKFVVFSPEIFIRTNGRRIETYPMKGTIDASLPNARDQILNDLKEKAEHFTIVDLMRSDLSRVATEVEVEEFRFIDKITTHEKEILQVSSKITGKLPQNHLDYLGDWLFSLLPAGSISGAPKEKTLEILADVEGYDRGFYTGIFGVFDGKNIDSAVMIRFIEENDQGLIYKSGGGITNRSDSEKEYQELKDKVYVPIFGNHTYH